MGQVEAVEGAASYIQQLQQAFLAAGSAQAGSAQEAANPTAARSALVEQLCGAARLPAADVAAKSAVRRFLAVHAIFEITPAAAGKVFDRAAQNFGLSIYCAARCLSRALS